MNTERRWAKGTLEYCAAVLLIAIGLPLLAFTALLVRGVLVFVAMAAIVVGMVLYCAHPGCRRWLTRLAPDIPAGNHLSQEGRIPGRD
ncbi:MAG TPA: hypothetical protein VGA70_00940 [Longimicrobiales bacterium]